MYSKQIQGAIKRRLFTPAQQQAFLEDVALLVDDGVIVNQAVEIISRSTTGLPVEVANAILRKLAEGKQLADGMQGWFANPIIEIIRAGEEGGTLGKSLHAAAIAVAQRSNAISALINALTYPLIVLCVGLIVVVFVNHSVFSSFITIKPIAQWPSNGQAVVTLANFVQHWWWLMLLFVIGITIATGYLLQSYIGQWRAKIDQIPFFSLYRKLTSARFMETLGLLLTNGVVLKRALKILQRNAKPYLAAHLLAMEYRLSGGKENIAEVLNTGLLDKHDLMRLRVIAKGKGFEHALIRQGQRAATQGMKTLTVGSRVLGAIILVAGSGLAAFLVIAIYSIGMSLSATA